MMLATTTTAHHAATGLRRVKLHVDLRAIADLIEVCFADRMDAGGRAIIGEMRLLSRVGPLVGLLALGDDMLRGIGQGFVWEQDGRIVGNVTLHRADFPPDLGRVTIIANVAVHPDQRRRGIARRMVEAAQDAIRAGGGRAAILQVEDDNDAALRLYEGLGFREERVWHHWRRRGDLTPPARLPDAPPISERPPARWREEYALAAAAFLPEQGGLGWQRPLHPREFHAALWRHAVNFLTGSGLQRWMACGEDGAMIGALWADSGFARSTRLTLLVHPAWRGTLERPLLQHGLWRLVTPYRPVICEHPADDEAASAVLRNCGFTLSRTLVHMRWDAP